MYVITVELLIRAPHTAAFQAAVMENAARSFEREPARRRFDVCTPLGDDSSTARTVFLYELYDDGAGYEAHFGADHFKAFDAHVARWVEPKIVRGWRLA